jgi:hypothetical protein
MPEGVWFTARCDCRYANLPDFEVGARVGHGQSFDFCRERYWLGDPAFADLDSLPGFGNRGASNVPVPRRFISSTV